MTTARSSTALVAGTKGDRTRRAIIAAARNHLACKGFDETTLADVAAEAGVSGPSVAFHFGSKSGLLTAVVTDYYDDLIARMETVVAKPHSPFERLVALARFWLREHDGNFDLYSVFAAHGGWRTTDSDSGKALRENSRRVARVFERLVDDLKADGTISADVTTRLLRDGFFGTAEHVLRGQLHSSRPLNADRAADEILDLLLRGSGRPQRETDTEDRLDAIEHKLDRLLAARGDKYGGKR